MANESVQKDSERPLVINLNLAMQGAYERPGLRRPTGITVEDCECRCDSEAGAGAGAGKEQ